MTSALFVVSEEGYWGEECIEPLTTLDEAGVEITVATPTGQPPIVDEVSLDPDEVGKDTAERVHEIDETDDRLNDPIPLVHADASEYDVVVFPGGHGTVWDINQDIRARALLRETIENDGLALVICHAVGLLGFTRTGDGSFLVDGRDVTGFPNAWESEIVDDDERVRGGRKLPYFVEDEVGAAGGTWDAELDDDVSVTVDENLITARGPGSSKAAAETLMEELDR
jgi:putative intracellular protease/amidase